MVALEPEQRLVASPKFTSGQRWSYVETDTKELNYKTPIKNPHLPQDLPSDLKPESWNRGRNRRRLPLFSLSCLCAAAFLPRKIVHLMEDH